MKESLRCIVCRTQTYRVWDDAPETQPEEGLRFEAVGHYGSTAFDPMDMSSLEIVICDECLRQAGRDGIVRLAQNRIGLNLATGESGIFAAGYYWPDREPVVWDPDKKYPRQDPLSVEPEDAAEAKALHSTVMWKASAVQYAREFLAAEEAES